MSGHFRIDAMFYMRDWSNDMLTNTSMFVDIKMKWISHRRVVYLICHIWASWILYSPKLNASMRSLTQFFTSDWANRCTCTSHKYINEPQPGWLWLDLFAGDTRSPSDWTRIGIRQQTRTRPRTRTRTWTRRRTWTRNRMADKRSRCWHCCNLCEWQTKRKII